MSDRLLVGTRKGLFELRRSSQWRIVGTAFLGDPVSTVLHDARDSRIYAGLALGHFGVKLRRSASEFGPWEEVAAPAFPKTGDAEAPSVSLIWCLEAADRNSAGKLLCGTIPAAVFSSHDGGSTWSLNAALAALPQQKEWSGGGYDKPGIHSIEVDPRDARHVLLGVSTGGVWITSDAGSSWQLGGPGMYAEYMPPEKRDDPNVQDVHRLAQCPAAPDTIWAQHHNGVFHSTDGARSWREVTAIKPSKFGFAVAVHPRDPETAWFVPAVKDECRVPVNGALAVARTRDGGKSFAKLTRGLPQANAYDLIYRHALVVDETGERLAMGSTTGHLWTSDDSGNSWSLVEGHLPPINCLRFAP